MEELIALLNEFGEYDLVEHNGEICKWDTDDEGEMNIYTDYTNNIISKKFGFIKWLVENNKIDYRNLVYLFLPDYAKFIEDSEYFGTYESLLIKLALSDTPIQDLISLLK